MHNNETFTDKLTRLRNNVPDYDFGKLPPQSLQFEEAVLGAIMLETDALLKIYDILQPEMFYKDEHKEIYSAILNLYSESKKADIITITNELMKRSKLDEVGGAYYISELTNRVGSSANIEYHTLVIVEKYLLREMIHLSSKITEMSYDETTDIFDLFDFTQNEFYRIVNCTNPGETKQANTIIKEVYKEINNPETEISIPSYYDWINEKSGGYFPGNLYVIASRPGHGKTAFGIIEALNAASFNYPVLYFSLEMTAKELIKRGISNYAKIHNFRVQRNNIDKGELQKYDKAAGKIEKLPLFINDKPKQSVDNIFLISKKHLLQNNIRLIIVDHFHLLKLTKKGDSESYSYNIQRLKEIAKELKIPIIPLFQLNREIEKESKRKPRNSDLREVGEQDADLIMFLRRPELFGMTEFDGEENVENLIIVDITKNRQGVVGGKKMYFNGDYQIIEEDRNFRPKITDEYEGEATF